MSTLQLITSLLSRYGYALLLPAAIIEGPIVTVIGAFLASQGVLNFYIVYVIAILGDVIGDAIYYWIGRAGRHTFIPRYGHYIGLTEERVQKAELHYKDHLWKTLLFGKVTQAPILLVIVSAGAVKADFKKLLLIIFIITVPKALVFMLLGFYLGKSYAAIDAYLHTYLVAMWILLSILLAGYLLFKFFKKRRS